MLTNRSMMSTIVDDKETINPYTEEYSMKETLSRHEWAVMETLWQSSPLFLSEIMEAMAAVVEWNRSSYLTYLKRMGDKGLIGYSTVRGSRRYYPLVRREDCIENESNYILSKLNEEGTRLLLASMIQKSGLTDEDRAELLALIEKLGAEKEKLQ